MCTFLKMDRSTYIKKFMISIVGFVLLACVNKVAGANSYVFVSPNVVRPGRDFTIHGTLVDVPYVPVTITAELFADQIVASAVVTVVGENVVKLDLPVPVTVNIGNKKTMRLEIRGTGGLKFSESKQVDFEDKSISMYIQTDKGIYKPGQTVKFRVFGVTPDMKVVNDKLKVELFDPKDNKINQWDVSNAELTSLNGVYIQEQVMSSEPVLGTWKLRAKLLSYGDDFEEKTFKVAEYVLPKFEVELDLPSFGRTDQTNFVGKVKAKYTFGQPVKGMADLLIKPTNERFEWRKDRRVSVSNKIELKFPINGEAEFTVPMTRLKEVEQFLSGTNLKFEVNVTEDLTKFKQSDEQELTFYDNHIKLKFPKSLPDTFKPGMVYDSVVIVSQQDDTPPDNINGQLKVTITEYRRAGPKPRPIIEPPEIFPERDDRWNRRRPRNERLFQAVRPPRRSIMPPWRPPTRDITKVLPPIYLNIPADGFVTFPVEVDKPITKLVIKAEYNGISTTKTLKKRHSPSNSYLQTRLLSKNPSVGQSARIEVKSTSAPGSVNYQVFSRGTIVESGKINMGGKKMVWTLPLTAAMAPRAKIVSFYVRNDGEIVADALVINIDGSVYDNKVDIQFSTYEAAPADQIQVDVRADAGSKVHILGVDKSVLLLASGNDVTNQQVLQDLREFDTKSKGNSFPFVCDWFCLRWPVSVGGEDTKDVFDDAGVLVITDALVYEHPEPIQHPTFRPMFMARMNRPLAMPGMAMPGRAMERQMLDAPVMMAAVPKMAVFDNIDASLQNLAPVQRSRTVFPETWLWVTRMVEPLSAMAAVGTVNRISIEDQVKDRLTPAVRTRKHFPETFIWSSVIAESNGSVSLYETVPDTITSWIASAFAVHPTSGLGVANPTSPLTVSLPFFVTANLPYSVIRGEKVIIQINIFNYNRFPVVAKVTFSKSDSFKNIIFTSAGATNASQDIVRTLTIQPDEGRPLYFPIIPDVIGLADIKVTAQSTMMSDAIHKRLLVEAEGSPREYNKPILVDLETVGSISETVDVVYPVGTVHGSEIVRATVIGDLMGPSISGLDSLLKLPYGCGEQNMLNFAPNIFIVKYLEATNSTNADVMHKAKDFMETGYQRELTYAHPDGSFSAFGESDKSGSTWLTAFVLKSFVQAKPYIFVDDKVIHKAIDWLITQQETMGEFKGTFSEPGRVIHKAMQGGSTSGKTSLTAYVLIALLEARSVEGVATKISAAQNSAMVYLEKQISQTNDVYDLAIVSYALTLAGSLQADTVWNKLDAKAKTGAGTKYWEKSSPVIDNTKPWQKRNGVAINIEITSYALLTLAYKQNRVEGVKVLKWITEQRNPNGGFSSTQDTVLALQSLAEMASLIYSSHRDITVTITGKGASEIFKINDINAQILQSRNLPPNVGTVTVTATGIGQALVQIEVLYNIETDGQKQSFELTVELIRESLDDYEVRACTRWLEQESSSMAVLEIESLSGFVANIDSVFTEPAHKKVELNHRKVIFYFDEITSGRTCATITMQRIGMVAGAQPVAVRIYDYYEPSKQVTEFYVPILLKNSEVCEICGQGCDACNVKPR